ncbi:MAG: NAD-dependent epimerase/dehydratase family protein [Actinomycetota bacterium]
MRLLFLGGTKFVGRHFVTRALADGHDVTIFNRGRTNPGLFDDVEELHGDRDGGLEPLDGRSFDRVVDVSGHVPRVVKQSAEMLKDATEHYTFISSVSVYADFTTTDIDEDAPLATTPDQGVEEITRDTYGPLKALCEEVVRSTYGHRCTIVRPGIVAGPFDDTDRFTYWCVRGSRDGHMVAPDDPGRPVQFIDARDLSAFTLQLTEETAHGVFNAVGPGVEPLSWERFLEACVAVGRGRAELQWVPEQVLHDAGVKLGRELPLYAPRDLPGFATVDHERAIAAGLEFSPLEHSIQETLKWATEEGREPSVGLTPEREAEILEALRRSRL